MTLDFFWPYLWTLALLPPSMKVLVSVVTQVHLSAGFASSSPVTLFFSQTHAVSLIRDSKLCVGMFVGVSVCLYIWPYDELASYLLAAGIWSNMSVTLQSL